MWITLLIALLAATPQTADLTGAWQSVGPDGVVSTWIVTDTHFAVANYHDDPPKFVSTRGGTWSRNDDGSLRLSYEFHTMSPDLVGTAEDASLDPSVWKRLDSGAPGALEGAWLMTGRMRDGEAQTRRPGARRTMKILSGTRFQWIAYNVETREFFGTGGGSYTTEDGVYTENLDFFSRDDSRVGATLPFQYGIEDGVWHHRGRSTAGNPMHELWERRDRLGI